MTLKKVLLWSGSGLGLIGVLFVVLRLHDYTAGIELNRFSPRDWSIVLVLAAIYGTANVFLALAWRQLLCFFGTDVALGWSVRTYGLTQLAKYVPGNVCHLAGRQALGLAGGVPGKVLVKAAVWELCAISSVGALFAVLALPLGWPSLPTQVGLILFVSLVAMAVAGASRWVGISMAKTLGWHVVFVAVSGLIFICTLALVAPQIIEASFLPTLCGAYVTAWLAGLITPGAPAGVGVREMVLLFLLSGLVAEADLLLAVVLARVVTVVGDSAFFLLAGLIPSTLVSESSQGNSQ